MSKELIERIDATQNRILFATDDEHHKMLQRMQVLLGDCKTALASREGEGEPVAWISERQCIGPDYGKRMYGKLPIQSLQPGYYKHIPLYERPQAAVPELNQQLIADRYEKLEPALEALVDLCNHSSMGTYDEVIAAEAALERLYLARKALQSSGKGGEV